MRIELHIDRIVLDGVGDPHQATAIREALHAELSRLLTTSPPTALRRSRRERRVSAPPANLTTAGSPTSLGKEVAHSIHSGLSAPAERRTGR